MKIPKTIGIKSLEILILLAITWLLFQTVFFLGTHPSEWIGVVFQALTEFVWKNVASIDIKNFLVFGFLAGAGGFLVYFPNILIMFFFSHLLKQSGMMDKAARVLHPLLKPFGLSLTNSTRLSQTRQCQI